MNLRQLALKIYWANAPSILVDSVLIVCAWWSAFWLRFNFDIPSEFEMLAIESTIPALLSFWVGLTSARVYRQVWRYTGLAELRQLVWGMTLGGLLSTAATLMMRYPNFPRSVLLLYPLIALLLLGAVRAVWRSISENGGQATGALPLLIVGSHQEAATALNALKGSAQFFCVGIASPLASEQGTYLHQVPVLGFPVDLADMARATGAATVLIASPRGSVVRRQVLLQGNQGSFSLLTLPRPDEWVPTAGSNPRKIELEDLLGRQAVELDMRGLAELFSGQTVLISGAGGSIGSELCRQVARLGISRLVCVDASEIAVYRLEQELRESHPRLQGIYYTANVRELERIEVIARTYKPSVIFHAAAYKHVPLMESHNEIEAVRTNILGTLNVARVAGACGAKKFVLISTDKAVNPTNIMGATKRMAELVVQSVARQYAETAFVSVRFGNVLGSSGSVVPLFHEQIAKGGPITVTHPDIVRYFMTIPEAARLVLQAGLMGRSGQIYVLDMGEPVKIADLARMMIRLSGKTDSEVPMVFTGLRPGEKLFEELLADDETTESTHHPKLRITKASGAQAVNIEHVLEWIHSAGPAPNGDSVRSWLRRHIPEYRSTV